MALVYGKLCDPSVFRPFRMVAKNIRCSRLHSSQNLSQFCDCFDERFCFAKRFSVPYGLPNNKKKRYHLVSLFFVGDPYGKQSLTRLDCLSTQRLKPFGTRLHTILLKTILNRFLNAKCPLRLRFPYYSYKIKKDTEMVSFFCW